MDPQPTDPSKAAPSAPPAPAEGAPAVAAPEPEPVAADLAPAATEKAKALLSSPYVKVALYLTLGLVAAIVVGFLLYWALNKTVNKRLVHRIAETETPILGTQLVSLPADKVPNSVNGKRQTISFWIYLHDLQKFKGSYRHVWHRGDENDDWEKASPAVYLDKDTNKLHITWGATQPTAVPSQLAGALAHDKYAYIQKTRGITIQYVPLQRWVHVAVVLNEEVNNGVLTAYVDGELVHVATSDKQHRISYKLPAETQVRAITTKLQIHNANLNKKGNIYIGGSPTDATGPGFSGLVSRIAIFNYDLNSKDIYNEYKKGPVGMIAGKIGYGVRSPVYRVG
jgi:hypothetical protein